MTGVELQPAFQCREAGQGGLMRTLHHHRRTLQPVEFMWNIKQQILNGAKATGIQVFVLPSEECQQIRSTILSKYTDVQGRWPTWIWEHFTSAASYADQDGWRWIGDYCSGREAIMLFSEQDEQSVFLFTNGQEITRVLEECFGFEFYLTNPSVDFVLCFNHHECLIATGEAICWLEAQRAIRSQDQSA